MGFRTFCVLIIMLTYFVSAAFAAAPPAATTAAKPVLQEANVVITATGENTFRVTQNIVIGNIAGIKNGKVEHTLSKINSVKPQNLTLTLNGTTITPQIAEGEHLARLSFPLPTAAADKLAYKAEYTIKLTPGQYSIPLLVPIFASTGKSNIVHIAFTAPPGNYIHENSFPILVRPADGNKVESNLANLPSHVSYVYDKQPASLFNYYNLISGAVFLTLMLIIVKWFLAEREKMQARIARQGGKV